VNKGETTMTMTTMITEELCQSVISVNGEESGGREEGPNEEPPIPTFGEATTLHN
jgi:hypothetical protein